MFKTNDEDVIMWNYERVYLCGEMYIKKALYVSLLMFFMEKIKTVTRYSN